MQGLFYVIVCVLSDTSEAINSNVPVFGHISIYACSIYFILHIIHVQSLNSPGDI